ncbi:MAG: M28 family peptidase [Nitrospiria bacterium]
MRIEAEANRSECFKRISEINRNRILNHLNALVGERHPDSAPAAMKTAVDYLFRQMNSYGMKITKQPIDSDAWRPFPNIIATATGMRASKAPAEEELLVVGAHYDTVSASPGADDNASGLAVLLEVARILSTMQGALQPQFVAFTMEEAGFLGSEYYLREAERRGAKIWGAIVLECVGYTDHGDGSQKRPPGLPIPIPDRGDFIGLVGNRSAGPIQRAFESAVKTHVPNLPLVSLLVPENGEAVPDTRRSDHVPFWDRGLRAAMLTDTANFRNPHYHEKSDRLETLDLSFITDIARALAAAIVRLCERQHPEENETGNI